MKAISAVACIALLAAGAAHAKGHDQSVLPPEKWSSLK